MTTEAPTLSPTERTTLHRLPDRGGHGLAEINAILDAGMICQIGYQMDGDPRVLPTVYWRMGDAVYWHGARESRALQAMTGRQVCFSVTLLDGLVLARSAFHHSANYRSVIAFGAPQALPEGPEKAAAFKGMIDRLYPGRWDQIRAPSRAEMHATHVLRLTLAEASCKTRAKGPVDSQGDLAQPGWAGVLPLKTIVGEPVVADDLKPGGEALEIPAWLSG